ASVGPEAKRIARLQIDSVTIGTGNGGTVVKPMTGVDPAIAAIAKGIDHPMSIAAGIEWTQNHIASVAHPIAIGVAKVVDVGNAEADTTLTVGQHTDRDV